MSENKGKAKVKSKSKSIAKSAGKNKAAVMNSRNPKKPMAISGDTMSNYAMYKKGGKVKKYQEAGTTGPPMDPREKAKQKMLEYDKYYNKKNQEDINKKLLKKAQENTPSDDPKKIYQTGYKVPVRKKGGKVKKSLHKAQMGGMSKPMIPRPMSFENPTSSMKPTSSMSSLDRLKLEKAARDKELQQQWSDERNQKLLEQARKEHDLKNPKSSSYGPMKQPGFKVKQPEFKAGGTTKKYKSGGGFPDLTGDGKVTKADILKGRGVFKKGGVKKYKSGGIFGKYLQKKKVTDEEGNSTTTREIKNPVTGIKTSATIRRSADGDKAKSTVKESYKKMGGKIKSKKK